MSGASGFTRRAAVKAGLAAAALSASPAIAASATPRAGRYRGLSEHGVCAFLGIRYARAERFASPVAEPFEGESLGATAFGPLAPQAGLSDQPQSEDCLYLNVWTPEADLRARRPVMVYFHGGAYTSGTVTDPLTHGARLAAAGDAVVVTVNQRLNALGYLWLSPLGPRFADSGPAASIAPAVPAAARKRRRPSELRPSPLAGEGGAPSGAEGEGSAAPAAD